MTDSREIELAGAADVEVLLDEMASAMAPRISESTALVGVLRRGAPLANMLADRLERLRGWRPEVGELKLKRYSDHLELLHEHPHLDEGSLNIDVQARHLVLIDDVLYTGESLMRAAGFLRHAGATWLQVAVLASRCGRTMPIHAEYIGCTLDIRPDWVIHCAVPPYESSLGISVAHRDTVLAGGE